MQKRVFPQTPICLLVLALAFTLVPAGVRAEGPWHNLESKHVSIYYKSPDELEKFTSRIRPKKYTKTVDDLYMSSSRYSPNDPAAIVDRLFLRVQRILGMRVAGLRVRIMVHPGQDEITEQFKRYMGYEMKSPAFYFKRKNTIHVHLERLHAGILAHEMAHAVIEHSLGAPRGSHASETLCRYVDSQIMSNGY